MRRGIIHTHSSTLQKSAGAEASCMRTLEESAGDEASYVRTLDERVGAEASYVRTRGVRQVGSEVVCYVA